MLRMPYIETPGLLTIKYNTMDRQLASDNKASKMQITSGMKEQFKQKAGGLIDMLTIGRMLMCKNVVQTMQWTQMRAVQIGGSVLMQKNNTMQTMCMSQMFFS